MGEVGRDVGGVRMAVMFLGIDRFMVGERWMRKREKVSNARTVHVSHVSKEVG